MTIDVPASRFQARPGTTLRVTYLGASAACGSGGGLSDSERR